MENRRLRAVIFRVFIPEQYVADDHNILSEKTLIEGTGCWSDFVKGGVFHCWALSYFYEADTAIGYTIAIIEDKFGNIYEVLPRNIKFQ